MQISRISTIFAAAMSTLDNISKLTNQLASSLASLVKIVLLSDWSTPFPHTASGEELVILGNGPSLNDTIANHGDFLKSHKLLAVNFAANTGEFSVLLPDYYVLADPLFFNGTALENVQKLWNRLNAVEHRMTLCIPAKYKNKSLPLNNSNIKTVYYNLTPVEGFDFIENWAYSTGLGMPRPRNVLIPSIMLALRLGFKKIYIAGADHSWTKTISVDDDNNVVSIQPHFYKENEKEEQRIRKDYMNYPLHQIMHSFYVAFKSYHTIERYAQKTGAKILNITPGSFIDAFERLKL